MCDIIILGRFSSNFESSFENKQGEEEEALLILKRERESENAFENGL